MLKYFRKRYGALRDVSVERRVLSLFKAGEIGMEDVRLLSGSDDDARLRAYEALGVENVIAAFPMPLALAEHFVVNGCAVRGVPMVTEERHVVAAASKAAKLVTDDGFRVLTGEPETRAQVLLEIPSVASYVENLPTSDTREEAIEEMRKAVEKDGMPFRAHDGGMLRSVARRYLEWDGRHFAEITLSVTTGNAMGARGAAAYAKALGEFFARRCDWKPVSWICLNDNPSRSMEATAEWPLAAIGSETMKRVQDNGMWAEKSDARAVTHNKGIMNGIDAVGLATGQDVRAIETGAWVGACDTRFARRKFRPLTRYEPTEHGLRGWLKMQITVGTVGGATSHPFADFSRRFMGVTSSRDLMCVMGAVGLAQNFAALAWALDA